MTTLIRSASLSSFLPVCQRYQLDCHALMNEFNLPLEGLTNSDLLISYIDFIDMLEACALRGGLDFGLTLAQTQGVEVLGPVASLLRHANSVGDALNLATRYLFVYSPAIKLHLQPVAEHPELVDVCFDIEGVSLAERPQIASLSLCIVAQGLMILTEGQAADMAFLPHPALFSEKRYEQAMKCPIEFSSHYCALRIPAVTLNQELTRRNPALQALTHSYLDRYIKSKTPQFKEQVKGLVKHFLSSGQANQQQISDSLLLHPSTVQRKLEAEGTSFKAIVDEVRKEQFLKLINLPNPPSLTQIAYILDYSEVSVLTRSCERWFNRTPKEFLK